MFGKKRACNLQVILGSLHTARKLNRNDVIESSSSPLHLQFISKRFSFSSSLFFFISISVSVSQSLSHSKSTKQIPLLKHLSKIDPLAIIVVGISINRPKYYPRLHLRHLSSILFFDWVMIDS